MTKKVKNLEYYLSLPWKFEFEKCPEGGYYARVKGHILKVPLKRIYLLLNLFLKMNVQEESV